MKLFWTTNPYLFLKSFLLRILSAFIPLLQLYVAKLILDLIISFIKGDKSVSTSSLIFLVAIELIIVILSDFLSKYVYYSEWVFGEIFKLKTTLDIMEHSARLELERLENSIIYDQLERINNQTDQRLTLASELFGFIQIIITLASLLMGVVFLNPIIFVLLILSIIPVLLSQLYFSKKGFFLIRNWSSQYRELKYSREITYNSEALKEVKIFDLFPFFKNRYVDLFNKYHNENKSLLVRNTFWGVLFSFFNSLVYYSCYLSIIFQTINGVFTIGELTFIAGSFLRIREGLQSVAFRVSKINEGILFLTDFFDFFKNDYKKDSIIKKRPFPKPIMKGFEFENVGFKYKNSEKWALKNLNLKINVGEKIALVGQNGSGKTTLIKLLLGFYVPTEGKILLDGYDLSQYENEDYYKEVSIIFQDFAKFNLPAYLNIAVGDIVKMDNLQAIETASYYGLSKHIIEGLPNKYQQMLGKTFANGIELSGGQWQRIAISRAYMRDAQLFILDEPTSALDAVSENEVFARITDHTRGKMTVLISHRISSVKMADKILVLENGQVLESGTHYELMKITGLYFRLYNLQAKGYQED